MKQTCFNLDQQLIRLSRIPFPPNHGTSDSGEILQLIIQAAHSYTTLALQTRSSRSSKRQGSCSSSFGKEEEKKLTDDQTAPIASSIDDCEDLSHESIDDCEDLSRDVSWDANDDSVLTMDNDLPCPCDSQTLDSTKRIFQRWRKEWLVSEDKWGEAYEEALAHARTEGTHETDIFLDQCAMHALEGRTILEAIRGIVHTSCPYCRERLKYNSVLLYDLLVSVVSQVLSYSIYNDWYYQHACPTPGCLMSIVANT
ncbi:hypothetical protein EDB19DRAFT_1829685 [Suillus lakei]|nr:hypothetical protein EDB19DRAFT_1829685 [Suillus lakei]